MGRVSGGAVEDSTSRTITRAEKALVSNRPRLSKDALSSETARGQAPGQDLDLNASRLLEPGSHGKSNAIPYPVPGGSSRELLGQRLRTTSEEGACPVESLHLAF